MKQYLVHTSCGAVQGMAGSTPDVRVFKGIRYATAERWEYPKLVKQWQGVYQATQFGACCYQPRAFYDEAATTEKAFYYHEFRHGDTFTYSEDCLFLNIWTPQNADNAPVLFYIHGGGFKGGCGQEKHFDGEAYCKKGVIVVTINYRLGPLGFCCLPDLAKEAGHTGNYALYDQLAALQWVHENIAAFGGNPQKITLTGQSAGAMSVQQHCVSPLSDGLVAGAIMQSGGGVSAMFGNPWNVRDSYVFWRELQRTLGADSLAALRCVAPQTLFEAFEALSKKVKGSMVYCGPVVDGAILPQGAMQASARGLQKNIPYLMGSTSEDIAPPIVHKMAKEWARMQADRKMQPSYTYFFDRQLPGDDCGAWHSADLWYAFGTLARCWRPFTPWDYALSDAMVSYFANFVHSGNPNGETLVQWLPMKKGQNAVLRFGDKDIHMGSVSLAKLTRTMLTKPSVGE